MSNDRQTFIKKLYHDVWAGNAIDNFDQYYHPELQVQADDQTLDYQQILNYARFQQQEYSDLSFDFKYIVSEGDTTAFHFVSKGIKDHKPIEHQVYSIYQFKDNKVVKCNALVTPKIDFTQ